MATLQQTITNKFLESLEQHEDVGADKAQQIRELLEKAKKPKPDEIIAILSAPEGGQVQ